jgi:hypothetical protein
MAARWAKELAMPSVWTQFLAIAFVFGVLGSQVTQSPKPAFAVVSVKKRVEPITSIVLESIPATTSRFSRQSTTVIGLVAFAFNRQSYELIGGPDWLRRDLFEVRGPSLKSL